MSTSDPPVVPHIVVQQEEGTKAHTKVSVHVPVEITDTLYTAAHKALCNLAFALQEVTQKQQNS